MRYQVIGDTMPAVEVVFDRPGETMYTQSGGMAWMSEGVSMDSNMRGGLGKSIGRMFSGESLFMATYKAERPGAMIAFASTVAGEVLPVDVGACGGMICQKGAFLCAEETVNLSVALTKKLSAGFFGGEGFIMQKLSGRGMAFLEIDGSAVEYDLAPGQQLIVETGNLAMMDETCSIDIQSVKGVKNVLFGGEGMFNTVVTGPGHVVLQTMPLSAFAGSIASVLPSKS